MDMRVMAPSGGFDEGADAAQMAALGAQVISAALAGCGHATQWQTCKQTPAKRRLQLHSLR